jgi:hypothetical protein
MTALQQRAMRHFLETQNLAHFIWTFEGEPFSLSDIVIDTQDRSTDAAAEIAWNMQRAEGRSEIGNAIAEEKNLVG